jgi:hypothetical protein
MGELTYDDWITKSKHTGQSIILPGVFEMMKDNSFPQKKFAEFLGTTPDQCQIICIKGGTPITYSKRKTKQNPRKRENNHVITNGYKY